MVLLSQAEWLAFAFAFALLLLAGAWHLGGILIIKAIIRKTGLQNGLMVLVAFWGLVVLHVSEIVIAAIVCGVSIHWLDLGTVAQGYGDSAGGLLYLAGITYVTLGLTQQVVDGPLRLLTMMLSLGGFMLITWSATYVFSIWQEQLAKTGGG